MILFLFLDSTCKWINVNAHTVLVFFWLISVSILPSSMNKASGGDRIPAELFKILNDDTVTVLHSVCQQIWKAQQWSQDSKKSVFILIPKEGNAKECSNYHIIVLISHVSKVMRKIFKLGFSSTWTENFQNFQNFKLRFEEAEEPETKLPAFFGS